MSWRLLGFSCATVVACGCNLVLGIVELTNDGLPPAEGGNAGAGGVGGAGGGGCSSPAPVVDWAFRAGSPGNADSVTDVALGPAGVTVLVGELEQAGELELTGGTGVPLDAGVFVAAFDGDGAVVAGFPQSLPGSNPRVAILGSTLFVSASFEGAIDLDGQSYAGPGAYIVSLQPNGGIESVRVLLATAPATVAINGLSATPTRDALVAAGQFRGSVDIEDITTLTSETGSESDIFVLSYSLSGASWAVNHSGGNGSSTTASAVSVASDGAIVVTGRREGPTKFGASAPAEGAAGLYVVRLNDTGDELASGTQLYTAIGGAGRSLSASSDGGMIVGAVTQVADVELETLAGNQTITPNTPVVIAMNAQHQASYARAIQGASNGGIDVAAVDGGVLVTGFYFEEVTLAEGCPLTPASADHVFAALLSADDGTLVWQQAFGGRLNDRGIAVAGNQTGVALAGTFTGAVAFGPVPLETSSSTDAFIVRMLER